jgi:acetyl esterase/lipase
MPRTIRRVLLLLLLACGPAAAGEGASLSNVPYRTGEALSEYEKQRRVLDVYLPADRKGFATLVWFHGGGLKGGSKDGPNTRKVAAGLAAEGLGVVVPNYRLSPKVTYPAYIRDAAAAVAWTHAHIAGHGGDADRIFIGGHSAGGYLTLMVGLDPRYLKELGVPAKAIAGLIPVSGQTMTHNTVRAERDLTRFQVTADEGAPVRWARKDTPPLLVIWADKDMAARAEENAYLVAILKGAGNARVRGLQIADRDHGSVAFRIADAGDPARRAILAFVRANGGGTK